MTNSLAHRGPDDSGFFIDRFEQATIGLGFRRLSIIDLSSAGHQPMVNAVNGDIIVFNGEVYNFKELRRELEQKQHQFKSNTDTEVVLKSFQEWGTACVERFNGMFVIVIYSPATGRIHFFRDRAGVKPLYYYWEGGLFLFASELKAFHEHPGFRKKIDFNSLRLYFHHGYVPSPYCIFRNTNKLEAGFRMEFNLRNRKIRKAPYWSLIEVFNRSKLNISFKDASQELERIMVSAYNYRMISDVPVGIFLSGGYDSTSVAALIRKESKTKLKTFTISFSNKQFDEGPYARAVAGHLESDHHDYHCTEEDAMQLVQLLPQVYDEPLADGGAIPNILVSQMASKQVKVVLSADGGDEVFAGYPSHYHARTQYKRYFSLPYPLRKLISRSIGFINHFRGWPIYRTDRISRMQSLLEARDASTLFDRLNQIFTDYEINQFLRKKTRSLYNNFMNDHLLGPENDDLDRVIAIDFQTFLTDDILPKVDRATSYSSIEGREPLLDHRIIEFASSLPSSYKLKDYKGKLILKDVVHRHVPQAIMDRPKMGFGLPIAQWGQGKLKPLFDECFNEKLLKEQGIFATRNIRELYQNYRSGNLLSFDRMYVIFVFQQWFRRWMMGIS